jgi:hypothetical protein
MAAGRTVKVKVGSTGTDVTDTDPYASLSAAVAGEAADLTLLTPGPVTVGGKTWTNIALHIECDPAGGDDTTRATISNTGWVLDGTHRLLISTLDSAWPATSSSFKSNGGLYRLAVNNPQYYVINANTAAHPYTIVHGLEIEQTNTSSAARCLYEDKNVGASPNTGMIFDSCIFYNKSTTAHAIAVKQRGLRLHNCIITSDGADGIGFVAGGAAYNHEILNCLIVNCAGYGIADLDKEAYIDCCNNVCYNNTTADWALSSGWRTQVGNYSGDATSPTVAGRSTITSADFVSTVTPDWTPASGSDIEQGGDDLVTDGLLGERLDAVGATRPTADSWAAGPLERVASSGQIVPTVIESHPQRIIRKKGWYV